MINKRRAHRIITMPLFAVIAVAFAWVFFVHAQQEQGSRTVQTLHVFPNTIESNAWKHTDAAYSQDVAHDGTYQAFTYEYAAFLETPTSKDVIVPEETEGETVDTDSSSEEDRQSVPEQDDIPDPVDFAVEEDDAVATGTRSTESPAGSASATTSSSTDENRSDPVSTTTGDVDLPVAPTSSDASEEVDDSAAGDPAAPRSTSSPDEEVEPDGEVSGFIRPFFTRLITGAQRLLNAETEEAVDTEAETTEADSDESDGTERENVPQTEAGLAEEKEVTEEETDPTDNTGTSTDEQNDSVGEVLQQSTTTDHGETTDDSEVDESGEQSAAPERVSDEEEEEERTPRYLCGLAGMSCERSTIEFSDFSLPGMETVGTVQSAQIRFSVAAKDSAERESVLADREHGIVVEYFFEDRWREAGVISIEDEVSNALNGDYYLFALPSITDISELENIKFRLSYEGHPRALENIFIDSAWIEVRAETAGAVPDRFSIETFEAGFESAPLHGDRLILENGKEIEFTHTDENEGETLIIKSDKVEYPGLSEATAYFNVTNTTDEVDTFALKTYFPNGVGETVSLEEWNQNKPKDVTVPEYQPFVYHCEAGWEPTSDPVTDPVSAQPAPPDDPIDTERSSELPTTEVATTSDSSTPEDVLEQPSATSSPVDTTQEHEQIEVPTTTGEERGTSTDVQSIIDVQQRVSGVQQLLQASSIVVPASSTTTSTSTSEVQQPNYTCRETEVVRNCDTVEGDGTACRVAQMKVNEHRLTRYTAGWERTDLRPGEMPDDRSFFKRFTHMLGFGPDTKKIPEQFEVRSHSGELYEIAPGETKYFKMKITFPALSRGEFWIEAIGEGGAYGLLDPWWNGSWAYRLPVTIDNTQGGLLEDHQVYVELGGAESDFWDNVQSDGADIRFLRESGGFSDWHNEAWGYRKSVTIDNTQVDDDLTDFPVMVSLTDSDLAARAQNDGDDILFTAGDGMTQLDHEIEYYASSTGELIAWVKVPSLSSTVDTDIFMYYGNDAVSSQEDVAGTWDNGYVLVQHLEEASGTLVDSSPEGNDGSALGTSPTFNSNSHIDGGYTLAGSGQERIEVSDDASLQTTSSFTASGWARAESWTTPDHNPVLWKGSQIGWGANYLFRIAVSSGVPTWGVTCGGTEGYFGGGAVSLEEWVYYSLTFDGTTARAYLDGVEVVNDTACSGQTLNAMGGEPVRSGFGFRQTPSEETHWDGNVDELRISDTERSADWLSTEYNNQSSPGTFYDTGSEEVYVAPTQIELDHWVQYFDASASSTGIWVQVDELAASASTTIYLYYGNDSANSASDEYETFTYDTLQDLYYVVTTGGSSLDVYSLIDNNVVQLDGGATTSLDRGESISYTTFTETSVLSALGPVVPKVDSEDMMIPISFAATAFAAPSTRGNENFHLYAPFATADYDVIDGTTIEASGTVTADTQTTETGANIDTSGIVESDEPILTYTNSNNDYHVLYPATTRDLYGIRSNTNYLGTTQAGTDFDIACSGGGSTGVTGLGRGVAYNNTTCANGAEGTGDAVRFFNTTQPIGAIQQADTDGNESTSFLPAMEFGTAYYLPSDAAYIAIACPPEGGSVSISVFDATDSQVASGQCAPGGDNPGKLYFDGGNGGDTTAFDAGFSVSSTDDPAKPFYVYYEDAEIAGGGDENNLWGSVQARKGAQEPVSYSFGVQELSTKPLFIQGDHRFYTNEDAVTPSDPWPSGGVDVSENSALLGASAVKDGEILRLRMNITATSNPAIAGTAAFKLQYASSTQSSCEAESLSWNDVGDISSGAAWRGYDNPSVAEEATLPSTVLTSSDVAQTYEEENPSAVNSSGIPVGDHAEWDWVLENNNALNGTFYCFRAVQSDGTALGEYTEYPLLLTNGAPGDVSLTSPFDNEKIADETPAFRFSATDEEEDDIEYQIQVDDSADFSSPIVDEDSLTTPLDFLNVDLPSDKAPFTNGDTIEYVSPTTLTDGETYWWRVRGRDPSGADEWGDWSSGASFTIDTSVVVSTWFQTTDEQFETNTLLSTEPSGSDALQLVSGSTTGTTTSSAVSFDDGAVGNAWGEVTWTDNEADGTLTYQVEYLSGGTWTLVPDSDLSGNTAGFASAPITLTSLDPNVYEELRLRAVFTDVTGTPLLNDWTVTWAQTVAQPTLNDPFDNEKVGTTTPSFEFVSTDPQNESLLYQIEWSTDAQFESGVATRTSDTHTGFENTETPADTDPFNSGEVVRYTVQTGDALTDGETYWWRVRASDPGGGGAWSLWSQPRSLTVATTTTVSTWFQTTDEQFDTGTLTRTDTSGDDVIVSTALGKIAVYREATAGDAITTSVFDHDWDTSVREDDIYALSSGSDIELDAGYYAVMYGARFDSSSGSERSEIQSNLSLAGSELPVGWSQGYIRRGNGADEALTSGAGIIKAENDSDVLTLQSRRTDINGAGVERASDASGISIMRLEDSWDYLRLGKDSSQLGPSGGSWIDVIYDRQDEVDSGSFQHVNGSADVTLKDQGHYLVFANTYGAITANDRTQLSQRLTLDGSSVDGSHTTLYIRGNQNGESTFEGAAVTGMIIETESENQVLNVELFRDQGTTAFNINEDDTSAYVDRTALTIVKLPDAEFVRLTDSGNDDMNPASLSPMGWDTEEEVDDSFTHSTVSNDSRIEFAEDGDYLFTTNLYASTIGGNLRKYYNQGWRVNGGALLGYGQTGRYDREANDADDAGNFSGLVLPDMTSGDYVEVVTQALGNSGIMAADEKGVQGVRIGSLLEADNRPITIDSPDIDFTDGSSPKWGSFSWNDTEPDPGGGAPFDQVDSFGGLGNEDCTTRPTFGNWTSQPGSDGSNAWSGDTGATPSGGVGPSSGNPDPYLYIESSAGTGGCNDDVSSGSTQTIESNTVDASTYALNFEFDWNMNVGDNTDASLHVDAWNGSSWDLNVTGGAINTGSTGDTWVSEGPIDLSGYTNSDFRLRIRYEVGNGTVWQNDVALDNLHIYGNERGSTATRIDYQVLYKTATGSYALIPNSDLPGNASGFSFSPVDLNDLDTTVYDTIRLRAIFTCNSGECPTLHDWTVTWSEGFVVSGTVYSYDHNTPITSGTVAIAINGVLQTGKTAAINGSSTQQTAYTTAGNDTFEVPEGVTEITVKAWGAGGGGGGGGNHTTNGAGGNGGGGGFTEVTIPVTPGETLDLHVGGGGDGGVIRGTNPAGGDGGGGGGRSEIERSTDSTVLAVAAGGGGGGGGDNSAGGGSEPGADGGAGGGLSGSAGDASGGSGGGGGGVTSGESGTGGSGGTGGASLGTAGSAGAGGDGGNNSSGTQGGAVNGGVTNGGDGGLGDTAAYGGGGGGGSGRYGGGGGSSSVAGEGGAGGGGGGSAYMHASATASSTTSGSGTSPGNTGDSDYAGSAGQGGDGADPGGNGTAGDDGRIVISWDPGTVGTWSIPNITAFEGDVITVFLDGVADSSEAVGVTVYDGANDIEGIELFERHLSIGSDDNAVVSNAQISLYDNSSSGDEDIFLDVDGNNDLSMCVTGTCADANLYIKEGNTYRPDQANSGNTSAHDIEIYGTLRLDGNTLRASGSWDNNGTLTTHTGRVIMTAGSGTETIDNTSASADTFNNLTFGEGSGSATWQLVDDLDVNGNLAVSHGTLAPQATTSVNLAKNLTIGANGNFLKGNGTTTFDGTGVSNWTDNSVPKQDLGTLVIGGTAKTVQTQTDVRATDLLIGSNVTLDATNGDFDIALGGSFTNEGSFNPREGSLTFTATTSGKTIETGQSDLYDLAFNGAGGSWSFPENTLTVAHDLTIATGTVNLPTATTSIGRSFENTGGTFAHNNGEVRFTGNGSGVIQTNGTQFLNHFYDVTFTGSGDWAYNDTNATTSNIMSVVNGSVAFPSGSLTIGSDLSVSGGGSFTHNNGEVILLVDGPDSVTTNGSDFNDLRFKKSSVDQQWLDMNFDHRIPVVVDSAQVSGTHSDFPVYLDLATLGSAFFDDVEADGKDIRITASDGQTELPFELVTINTAGETGELYFNANAISDTSSTTFYLYYGNASATPYSATSTYGRNNVWTNGYEAVYHLEETGGGVADEYLDSTGNGFDAQGGGGSAAATPGTAGGVLGTAQDFDGSNDFIDTEVFASGMNLDGGGSKTISAWTFTEAYNDGGIWNVGNSATGEDFSLRTLTSLNQWRAQHWGGPDHDFSYDSDFEWVHFALEYDGSVSTVYADGNSVSNETTALNTSDGFGVFIGRWRDGDEFQGLIDEVRIASVDRGSDWLTTEYNNQNDPTNFYATSTTENAVPQYRNFDETDSTALGDVTIESGEVHFPTGTFTVGGSFDNNATFLAQEGLIHFESPAGTETISFGSSSPADLLFAHTQGDWTILDSATTTGDVTLTSVNNFTLTSGATLYVAGAFNNTANGASTTWSGSTLSLAGTGNYAINTKADVGDQYGTLRILQDTDISMWNSFADDYDIDGTASLYSQDHAGVDGDLYIFGDYVRIGGTEYWSYTEDFDGVDLGGGDRQANVRFADNASASLASSTLKITGISSASTTIENQGSGTYSLSVTGGTTTAEHYEFSDLGATGLSLLGATAVTSLSNGSFESATDGGTTLTLSSTTINADPAKQIFDVNFSTTSAISAFNVTQEDGTPTSYWWFRNTTGNLQGEAYDDDTGNPGSIRWDDSSLTITASGTVYADAGATPMGTPVCDDVTQNVRIVVNGGTSYTTTCDSSDGTYSISGITITGDPVLTAYLDTNGSERAVTVTKTPTEDIADLDLYANRVITRHESSEAMAIADMTVFDENDDADIPFVAATGTPNTLTLRSDTELLVYASTTFTPNGEITLESGGTGNPYDGTFHIDNDATFNAADTQTHRVGGRFQVDTGGVFNAASSSVVMTATTSGKNITTPEPQIIHFHALSFTGAGGVWSVDADITATSSIAVDAGEVNGVGDITITEGALTGAGVVAMDGGVVMLTSTNTLGSTTPWSFHDLSLGDGSSNGTTTRGDVSTTTVNGTLTIASGHVLDADSSAWDFRGSGTVFVENGIFAEGTSVVRYSASTSANILSTNYYDLELNGYMGTPNYTVVGLGVEVLNDLLVGGEAPTVGTFTVNDPALTVHGDVWVRSNGTLVGSDSAEFIVHGNWNNDGVYTHSGGTVTFAPTGSASVAAGDSSFGNVNASSTGSLSITEHATATQSFTLGALSAFTVDNGVTLAVGDSFTNGLGGAATTWTGSTLRLYDGEHVINTKDISDTYGTLLVAGSAHASMWNSSAASILVNSAGSLYSQDHDAVDGDLYIWGDHQPSSGTDHWSYATDFDGTDLTGGNERLVDVYFAQDSSAIYTQADLSVMGDPTASTTLQNQGSGTYGVTIGGSASTTWSYFTVRDMNSDGITFTGTPEVKAFSFGDIEVSQSGGSGMTVGGSVIDANPAKNFNRNRFATSSAISAFNVTATNTSVSSWRFTNHYGNLSGEAFDNDPGGDPGYVVWDDSAAEITISGNVYADEGSTVSGVCDGSTQNIHLRVAGITGYTTSCDGSTGAFSIPSVAFSSNDTLTLYIDGETEKAANVSIDPVSSIGTMHLYEDRVIVRHENTDPISISDMAVWDSSDDADIPFTAVDAGTDTLTLPSDTKLIVWNNKTFEPNGNVTLSGGGAGAAYDGTLELYNNAAFIAQNGESHSIGGSFISGTNASFTAAESTVTFTTNASARGIDTNDDAFFGLVFNGTGSWNITNNTLDVGNDLTIDQGAVTLPSGTTTISGSFNNTGGSFNHTSGTIVFDSTNTGESVTTGGSALNGVRFDGSGGEWAFQDVNATATLSFVINEGDVTLPSGTLTVGGNFDVVNGSVEHNNGSLRMVSGGSETKIDTNGSDLSSLEIDGTGSFVMHDQSIAFLDDILIDQGSLTLATGTVTVGGSFQNSGGAFDHASGTILFNSDDGGEVVDPGGSEFHNINFANSLGGWTLADDATTTNNFTLSSASAFILNTGSTLVVEGVFTNNVGGSGTTWDGSTLVLTSGTPYSAGTKTASTEHYQTLIVGDDTDVRFWNSIATTTSVATSGSLYSQDHAGVDGSLYVYGDYLIATTTEYWSYETDFDGASLTGGSERQVTVSVAPGATTTMESGSLQIVGSEGATTTLQVQGSGTHAFNVSGGTLNAQYYSLRDLDQNGLDLSGSATNITTLSNGDLELAVDGGRLITVEDATLNVNASKVFSGIRFATTTAITGTNVFLDGTTTNAWTFTSHYGNLAGEVHDDDGSTDACGALRWDDSSCLVVEQTNYRWRHDDGNAGVPDDEWYDFDWDKRKHVRIVNHDDKAYSTTSVPFTVQYDSDMQSDFADLRFTADDGTSIVSHWVEDYTASTEATVWVNVPSMPTSGVAQVFMYYGNGAASNTSATSTTFDFLDDFEDGNISEYAGDTSLFNVGGTFNYERDEGLDASGNESSQTSEGIYRTDVTVAQGQTIRYLQYIDTSSGSGDEACTLFGVQGPGQNYAVCLELFGTDRVSLARDVTSNDVSGTVMATTTITYATGWHEVEIDWRSNDVIDVTVSRDGSVVATTSASDSNYSSGGIGFSYWFQNGGWDIYSAQKTIDTDPTVHLGSEQERGGATWATDLNTQATGFETGDIARLRVMIENAGLNITDEIFQLEYAAKGAAPSCSALSSASFTPVPTQSSCGTEDICMQSSTHVTNGEATVDLLAGSDLAFTSGAVIEDPSNQTGALDLDADTYTEFEYTVTPTVNTTDSNYCFRVVKDGEELDSYVRLAELSLKFDPTISVLSLNGGSDITLDPGTTTTITAEGVVSDVNGYTDLDTATSTIFRSAVGTTCSPDENNCYRASGSQCTFSNCSGDSCDIQCSVDMYYFADPTDMGTYAGETWRAFLEIQDNSGAKATATAPSIDLLTLRAAAVDETIDYGALEPDSDTGAYNASTTVENIGNDNIDISIEGSDLSDGSTSLIPADQQKFATSTFSYSSCVFCSTLSTSTTIDLELDLNKPTSIDPAVTDSIFWGIRVPYGVAASPHEGTNTFYATGD